MKIVFMGTPAFAVPSLDRLCADGHTISLVVTQPDKPKGRSARIAFPPVKEYALSHQLPVYQPDTLKTVEAQAPIVSAQPDLIVVVAYGRILPSSLLSLSPAGCINVHASLLPRYRGAAPMQWAVLNGEKEVGVTTMRMDKGIDTGDMLLTFRCPLPDTMTAGELHDRLSVEGAQLLSDTLSALQAGTLTAMPQDNSLATYAPMLNKSQSPLDFRKPAVQLHNQVRGLHPWPGATCRLDDKMLKIHASRVGENTCAAFGEIIKETPLTVACGDNTALELLEVQCEGGKRMSGADFLRGHPAKVKKMEIVV